MLPLSYQLNSLGGIKLVSFQCPAVARTAAQGTLRVPLADKSVESKSFMVRSAVVWNKIPADIRNCKTLGVFKKNLKQWIKVNVEIS